MNQSRYANGGRYFILACLVFLALVSWELRHAPLVGMEHETRFTSQRSDARSQHLATVRRPVLHTPLLWMAPFFDASSFGMEATQLMLSLLDTKLIDQKDAWIGQLQMSCTDSMATVMDSGTHSQLLQLKANVNRSKPAIVVCHNMPRFYGRPSPKWASCDPCPPPNYKAAYTIARAMAETSSIPDDFVAAINSLDEVWVPSDFSRGVLADSGVTADKIHIVPLAVNTTLYDPSKYKALDMATDVPLVHVYGLPESKSSRRSIFTFLSVFKWENRKGWDVLLAAYLTQFTFKDRVQLIILTHPFVGSSDIKGVVERWATRNVRQRPMVMPRLFIITEQLTSHTYARLLASVDAFVLPTRGEGWGLPIVEAMSMGLPVIATNYSGPTAYLDEEVGYPLGFKLAPVPDTEPDWFRGSKWAEPDMRALGYIMRYVSNNAEEARHKGQLARERMLDSYSPEAMGMTLFSHLLRIERKLPRATAALPAGGGPLSLGQALSGVNQDPSRTSEDMTDLPSDVVRYSEGGAMGWAADLTGAETAAGVGQAVEQERGELTGRQRGALDPRPGAEAQFQKRHAAGGRRAGAGIRSGDVAGVAKEDGEQAHAEAAAGVLSDRWGQDAGGVGQVGGTEMKMSTRGSTVKQGHNSKAGGSASRAHSRAGLPGNLLRQQAKG